MLGAVRNLGAGYNSTAIPDKELYVISRLIALAAELAHKNSVEFV